MACSSNVAMAMPSNHWLIRSTKFDLSF